MQQQTNKIEKRIIAILLIFTMTFGNFGLVGRWSYAAGLDFFKDSEYQFNAFFAGHKDADLNIRQDVKEPAIMNLDIGIAGDGYIKDGALEILGKDGSKALSYTAEAVFGDYEKIKETSNATNTEANTVVNNTVSNTVTNTAENVLNNTTSNIVTNTTNTVSDTATNETSNTIATPNNISAGTSLEPEYKTKLFEDNKVKLDQINTNTKMYLKLKYISSDYVYSNSGDILKFSGIYVDKDLKEHIIEKTIDFSINWISKQDIQVSSELVKYIPYNIGEKSGVILQEKIVVNKEGDILVPTKQTIIETNIPTISGILPISVDVIPSSIKGTTGKDISNISGTDVVWNYQNETQTLKIETNNDMSSSKAWAGKGYDEYLVTYQYDMKIDEISEENRVVDNKIKVQNKLCNGEETNKEINNKVKLEGKIGDIVSFNTVSTNNIVNKAKMLANYNTENVYETEMQSKIEINISSSELVNQIALKNGNTNFITSNGESLPTGSTYYKSMVIKRDNLLSLIGEQGSLDILSEAGEVLCTINAQTPVDANNEYVINFTEPIRSVIIQTSQISGAGILDISVTRGIKTNEYDKAVIKDIKSIEENIEIYAKYADRENLEKIGDSKIVTQLENAKTQANLELSLNEISTYNKIENAEMRIELNNNKDTSDMYENGTFLVVFPKSIQEVNVNNAGILYGDEFTYTSAEQIVVDGQIAIKLEVSGKQSGFNTINLSNGTNLVLNMDIKANIYAPNKVEKIELFYINSDVNEYAVPTEMNGGIVGYDTKEIKVVSGNGLVNITTVSELQEDKEEIAIRGEKKTLELDAYKEQKSAEMKITLVNNEKEAVKDVQVLGRIPFENNKSILTNESLGSTFTANMTDGIKLEGLNNAKVYYSEKEDATADLANGENAWTMQVEDYSKVKSYLIDLKDEIINPEDVVDIKYNVEIPANLEYDEESIATHKLFYTLKGSNMEETYTSIALATPEGPDVSIEMIATPGEKAYIGDMITYTIRVRNTGTATLNNVNVNALVPEGTVYTEISASEELVEYVTNEEKKIADFHIDKLEAEQEVTFEYMITVTSEELNGKNIDAYATVVTDEFPHGENSEVVSLKFEKPEFDISIKNRDDNRIAYPKNSELSYEMSISNISGKIIKNVKIENTIPEGVTYKENNITLENAQVKNSYYDEQNRKFIIELDEMVADANVDVKIIILADTIKKDKNVVFETTAHGDETEIYRNQLINFTIAGYNTSIEKSASNTSTYIYENEEITLYTLIQNTGRSMYTRIYEIVPKEFELISASYALVDENQQTGESHGMRVEDDENIIYKDKTIAKDEKILITCNVKVKELGEVEERECEVYAKITDLNDEDFNLESNKIKYIIRKEPIETTPDNTPTIDPTEVPSMEPTVEPSTEPSTDPTEKPTTEPTVKPTDKPVVTVNPTPTVNPTNTPTSTNNNNNNINKTTYKIIGTAWLDENKDGVKDSNEKDLSGITVGLINAETNNFEKDSNGNYIKAITKSDGTYTLEGMTAGKYIVVFEYDTENYSVTKYKVSGVAENKNSNVATNRIRVDGKETTVAVSDVIEITNENIGDINIGLIKNSILDFKIEKTVKKITVTTNKGTETKDYNNVTLAKTEIHAKEMAGAKVTIDYEIKVSNVGEVPGIIGEVIDYIPSGTQLVQGSGWTSKNNNQVVNTSLRNETLLAGESTTLNISVEKTMTNDNTGVVENKVELNNVVATSSNESIVANDTDIAKANVIITVKTGIKPAYIIIAVISSLMIIGIGIKIYKGKNN